MLASGTPFFQEFHCVLQDDALGLLIKPMNDIPVVRGLKPGADGMPGAAERAGVTVGSILVAVNGRETLREGFKATMLAAKTASRPVTLGFRRLHAVTEPVPEQGPRPARRYWQGYLFARFAAARSWTGRFVLREDGELRAYPGKDLVDGGHVEDLRVVHAPLRASAEDVAAAARTVGDLGDDGRGSLDPRAFAAPVVDGDVGAARDGPSDATRWAFFRGETPEARLDWIAALTTLAVAFEEKGDDDGSSADAGATTVAVGLASAKREVARQGYLWVKAVKGDEDDDEETRGAGELLWYVSPPADDGEVPTGRFASLEDATVALAAVADRATLEGVDPSEAAHRRRRFEFSVREARGERRTVKLTALSAHEGKQWVAALEAAAALKVEPLPVVDDGGDDDAAAATEKPREVSDEKDREARLIALSANPGVVLKLPEAAYGLLVPRGSGGGGVDRGAFTALAGQRLVPLCDCYVADLVYDALLASQAAGGARDSPQTVAQNTGLTKASRRAAEPIQGTSSLLGYDAFRRYCDGARESFGAVPGVERDAWDDLRDATVRLIPLDFVESASPAERGEAAFVLKKAEVHTIRLGAKSKDEEEPEDTLSPLGAYPGGGRIFGNDSTFHQPLLSLEALREADGPPLPEARRHEADADGSDVEDAVALGLEDRPRKARRRPSSNGHPDDEGQRYECARVRVRRPLFEARRRPGGLWAAANVLRRAALLKACRRLPKGLAFFSAARREREPSKPLADYLVGEGVFLRRDASVDDGCCARMEDRSWLRGLLVFAARSDDLDRRWAKEVRSFAPARFRDEWHVFWAHVDPIWDGFYDTAVSLRRWDRPAASGGLCGGLLLVAYADALAWLPCLLALAYAAFVARGQGRRQGGEPGVIANLARRLSLPSTPAKPGGSLPPEAPADDGLLGDQPSVDRSPAKSQLQHLAHEFGVFGQLRELRQGLGKAQAKLHEYNTYLLQCRALHRWADPDRTWLFVAGLLLFAVTAAVLPLN
ncbi:hypothetical protein JL720_8815 [Aureococcus anophagefferens]|nr:hypothetical protein JL720_8815 [Aureococcus anophagefferens]